jgi:hypothetical protein
MWETYYGRWAALLYESHPKHPIRIAHFDSEEDAAIAYDRVALHRWGRTAKRNFPGRDLAPASVEEIRREVRAHKKVANHGSRWDGVSLRARSERPWYAEVTIRGKAVSLGSWATEKEAAIARDRAVLFLGGREAILNFPAVSKRLGPADPAELRAECERARKATTTSRYRGVVWNPPSHAWRARIGVNGAQVHLGVFDDEGEAAAAYDAAALRYRGANAKLNFPRPR